MTLIYILGTDGAGKTTVARRLRRETLGGCKPAYIYCQHRPFLVWLVKLPARLLFMRRTDQFNDYDRYKARKSSITSRWPRLTRLYMLLCYFDMCLQTWPKLLRARWASGIVLVDRYYLDWVVNLALLQQNSCGKVLRDARWLERLLPKAQLHLFLDVAEETAFQRKNDIQSVQYLRERKELYLDLAPHYGFQVVDANQDAEAVFQQVRVLVETALNPSTVAPTDGSRTLSTPASS